MNMAVERKHTAPQAGSGRAVGKMASDAFAVLKDMPVTVNDFELLFHLILPVSDGSHNGSKPTV
jgi:hypothetical protein